MAQRLQSFFSEHPHPDLQIFETGTNGIDVMLQAHGASKLTMIDACSSGSEPGTVFQVPGLQLVNQPPPGFSPHNFRWDHALHTGRILFQDEFPQDITVFLIEVFDTTFGENLSPAVAASVDRVCALITSLIHEDRLTPIPTQQPKTP